MHPFYVPALAGLALSCLAHRVPFFRSVLALLQSLRIILFFLSEHAPSLAPDLECRPRAATRRMFYNAAVTCWVRSAAAGLGWLIGLTVQFFLRIRQFLLGCD